ncbi:hypothetical protein FCULG_00000148 [Fusarium culmorum]|uniref:Ubiquitin 3 binding protein But2 C-terminal domain-containing protein n=1 Tax=Fusarium culmorum TaxID=5516 RepID=A0A2T4GJH9_FUSCU|nr:hypothetical protein FCULG_00000148 [Fusarium culmorum]
MRPRILHSVALSLAGLWAVEASVCKPRPLSSGVSTSLTESEITSSGFVSESFTISSTVFSDVTAGIDTTTDTATGSTSTIGATTVDASTEVTSTAESTIVTTSADIEVTDTTTAPTSVETTTVTTITTTTTAELPTITEFRIKGARAPVEGAVIYSDRVKGNYLHFTGKNALYTPVTFSVDALTGHLLIDNSLPICTFFTPDLQDFATLGVCPDSLGSSQVAITCAQPVKYGDALSCSVPSMSCVKTVVNPFVSSITCTATGEVLKDMSTDYRYDIEENLLVIGHIDNGAGLVVHAM